MNEMTVEQRIENEKRILKKLMIIMGGHGWWPELVDDGGEPDEHVPVRTAGDVVEAVTAVDEAQIMFRHGGGDFNWVQVILGNGNNGYDLVADYTLGGKGWDEAWAEFDGWIEGEESK